MDWTIEYYTTPEGRCPVKGFIDSLSVEGQAKYILITRLLKEYGIHVKEPYVRQITGHKKLYEIRIRDHSGVSRIFTLPTPARNLSYCTAS